MRVVGAVAPHVRERELNRIMHKHPGTMTAYDLTLQAMDQLYRMDRQSFFRSADLLHQAVMHDPGFAPAWSQTAFWHLNCFWQGWSLDVAADVGCRDPARRRPRSSGTAAMPSAWRSTAITHPISKKLQRRAGYPRPRPGRRAELFLCDYVQQLYLRLPWRSRDVPGPCRAGGPPLAARPGRLLPRARPVAGAVFPRALRQIRRVGTVVGGALRHPCAEPALPDRQSGRRRQP